MIEGISKILSALKIPLKILLPAIWIFSGSLILLPEKIMRKLNLYELSTKNGFIFGLLFLISSCFLIVYIIGYFFNIFKKNWNKKTINIRTIRKIYKYYSDKEFNIIIHLFRSDGYTDYLDYSDPVIKGLESRKAIYKGDNASIIPTVNDELLVAYVLQPYIWQALDWKIKRDLVLKKKFAKRVDSLSNKNSDKNKHKISEYRERISKINEDLDMLGYSNK